MDKRAEIREKALKDLQQAGVLMSGHFDFGNGYHGRAYLNPHSLFRHPSKSTIAALYGAIVAQARLPVFYQGLGVPDTVLGRFDMIVLHLVLLLRRLREGQASHRELAQAVFDAFCRDMDDNLREMGISDQGVPREMHKVGEAFYGRAQAYEAALGAPGDAGLAAALARNVYCAAEPLAAASLTRSLTM